MDRRANTVSQALNNNTTKIVGGAVAVVLLAALIVIPLIGGDGDETVQLGDADSADTQPDETGQAQPDDGQADGFGDGEPGEPQSGEPAGSQPAETDDAQEGEPAEPQGGGEPSEPQDPGGGGEPSEPQDPGGGGEPSEPQDPDEEATPRQVGETRGVSDSEVVIGVAVPDIGAFGEVNPAWDIGDMEEQMEAVLDGWHHDDMLPVHGRDVRFVYREFDILSTEEKIAACRGLIEDEGAFAVVAGRFFGEGGECVADRFETPVVSVTGEEQPQYDSGSPFFYTLKYEFERMLRNWMAWADVEGILEGKTIGLYYETEWEGPVERGIRQELERRGYEIAEEAAIDSEGQVGASQAPVAVQRMQSAGVDLVIPASGGTAFLNFTTQAEGQLYRPDYIITDTGDLTTDAGMSPHPDEQVDGALGFTQPRTGEIAAGMELPDATRWCGFHFERYTGRRIGPESPESAEYDNLRQACDLGNVMRQAIENAGRELGHLTLVDGLQSIHNMEMAGAVGHVSFRDTPFGAMGARTTEWSSGDGAWFAQGPFGAFEY